MRFIAGLVSAVMLLQPVSALAEEQSITRRDGFLKIWETILRPAEETRENPFIDVPEGSPGFLEITYAKRRGLVDGGETFSPDSPLTAITAYLWLLRTRNVDDPALLTIENLSQFETRFGSLDLLGDDPERTLTENELMDVIRRFDQFLRDEDHEISFYSENFHGRGTAFGETFDMYAMTAAHRTFPHNTVVRVTSLENGKSVTVRINDRGPFVKGRDMDLSLGAFTSIAVRAKGKIRARFERLGDARMLKTCADESPRMVRIAPGVRFTWGVPHTLKLGESLTLTANAPFVVRGVTYPDGNTESMQSWILDGEKFTFTPSVMGIYRFRFGTVKGRSRVMEMEVADCTV